MPTVDLRDMDEAVADTAKKPAPAVLVSRQVQFTVEYEDPATGDVQVARLTGQVPTAADKALIGRKMAYLAGKFPFDSMPHEWQLWAEAYANVETRLKDPPDWLKTALAEDDVLLDSLWGRLLEHERLYFRADGAAGDGEARGSRVVLR